MPARVSLQNSVEHAPDGEWGCSIDFGSYPAMPNSSAMKVAWAIASSLATHLALPFRIIFTARQTRARRRRFLLDKRAQNLNQTSNLAGRRRDGYDQSLMACTRGFTAS